jgi:S1-C subfamily serine protease/HEAT repeat protein
MSIRLTCPGCRKQLALPDTAADQVGRCPGCNTLFHVPAGARPDAIQPMHHSAPPPRRTAVAHPIPRSTFPEETPATGLTGVQKLGFALAAAVMLAVGGYFTVSALRAERDKPGEPVVAASSKAPEPVKVPIPPRADPVPQPPAPAKSRPAADVAEPAEDIGTRPLPAAEPAKTEPSRTDITLPPVLPPRPPVDATAKTESSKSEPPKNDRPVSEAPPRESVPVESRPETEPPADTYRPGAQVYERLLKSTVMVLRESGGRVGRGTGSFINREHKLILTNYHVVGDESEVWVTFPAYDRDKLIVDTDHYKRKFQNKEFIRGKVVRVLKGQDLALVELEKVPSGTPTLRLAPRSARPGEVVHSIGNPGASDAAWLYTKGEVRQVSHKKWKSSTGGGGTPGRGIPGGGNPAGGFPGGGPPGGGIPGGGAPGGTSEGDTLTFEADVLETTSPTNPGDSGGPLVNDFCQLVGVTQGANTRARNVSLFINVTEVRKILKEHGIAEDSVAATPGRSDNLAVEELVKGLDDADPKVRARSAARLADLGPDAKVALHGLIRALSDADRDVRKQAGNALLQLGAPERGDLEPRDVRYLRDCLRDEAAPGELHRYVIKALTLLGADARAAVSELGKAVRSEDKETRQTALAALDKLGAAARKAAPDLAELLKLDDRFVTARAAMVLLKIDDVIESEEAKAGVNTLITLQKPLTEADLSNKELAALAGEAIKALIQAGKPAVPAIRKALTSTFKGGNRATGEDLANAIARQAMLSILEGMGPKAYSAELDRDLAALQKSDPAAAVREGAKQTREKMRAK